MSLHDTIERARQVAEVIAQHRLGKQLTRAEEADVLIVIALLKVADGRSEPMPAIGEEALVTLLDKYTAQLLHLMPNGAPC